MQRGHLSSIREAMDPCSCSPSDRGCAETRKRSVDAGSKKGDCETGNSALRNTGGLRLWPRDELAAFVSMDDVSCHIENASSRHKPVPARSCFCRARCHRSRAAPEHSALAQLCRLLRCAPPARCQLEVPTPSGTMFRQKATGLCHSIAYSPAGEARLAGSGRRIA